MKHRLIEKLGSAVAVVLLACCAVLICVAFRNCAWRLDCTEEKAYTLSDATAKVLSSLPRKVTIHYYYSKDLAQMPVVFKNYARRIEDLLREYEIASKGKLKVIKRNPKPDTDAEDSAALDGIIGQPGAMLGIDQQVYLGLAVLCGDQKSSLPFLNPERENLLEYDITRAVMSVSAPAKHKIGVMSALKLFGGVQDTAAAMDGKGGMLPAWFFISELKKDYDVVELPMNIPEIPAEIDIVLAIHPRELPEATELALDQFVLRGGHLAAFLDPICLVDMQNQPHRSQYQYMPPNASSSMNRLLAAWGIGFSTDEVMLDRECATPIRTSAQREAEKMPNVLSLSSDQMLGNDVLLSQLSDILMLNAGRFTGEPAEGIEKTVLLWGSRESGVVEKYVTQRSAEDMLRDFKPNGEKNELAVRLTGRFRTAFPDKAVLKESAKPGMVILVGDADMLYDPFCVRQSQLFGQSFYQPLNGNLALVQNLVESMTGDTSLFAIRSRNMKSRPFRRVQELERRSEEAYRDEIEKFENEVESVQRELYLLEQQKGKQDKELLSTEQRNAIIKIRRREGEARQKLKDVRKRQRREVEQLENNVMLVNIALMPALVILCGLAIAIIRHRRSR